MKKKKRKLSKIKYLKIYLKNFLSIFILKISELFNIGLFYRSIK